MEISITLRLILTNFISYPQPQEQVPGLGSFPFARRYSENRCFFLFLRVLRCFNSPGLPLHSYFIHYGVQSSSDCGFPHSDICGSMTICVSPQLFAAYRVLLRLLVPRHSPCALSSLTFFHHLFLKLFEFNLFSICAVFKEL